MKRNLFVLLLSFLFVPFSAGEALAANGSMSFFPQVGNFDKPFSTSLIIDGGGEKFNAAQATVAIPANLAVKDLVLGDCNFSFFDTPSIQNPSFKGIILASSSQKCTVYTLSLAPIAKGKSSIVLTDANIKRYGDASEILSKKQNTNYTLTGVSNTGSVLGSQTMYTPKSGLYTVSIKVLSKDNKPLENAEVILNPISKKDKQEVLSDKTGLARFSKLKPGIYTVTIEKNGQKLGERIINVSGPNYTLNFGMNVENKNIQISPITMYLILFLGIFVGIAISIFLKKLRWIKRG